MDDYAHGPEKFPAFAELFCKLGISHCIESQADGPIRGLAVKIQKLNSRGSVDQVMKEVKKQGGLNAEIQSRIGHQLRAMYDDVVRQGVPDRFVELIRKLDVPAANPQLGNAGDKNNGGE
jgi:Anti-sigma factor NepR